VKAIIDAVKQKITTEKLDSTKQENYLSDQDFVIAFKMSRDEFNKLPKWKQGEKKKEIGLF